MKIEKGQRWKIKNNGVVLEVLNPNTGECIIKDKANSSYTVDTVGNTGFYSIALSEAVSNINSNVEDRCLEYLQGQDAPK